LLLLRINVHHLIQLCRRVVNPTGNPREDYGERESPGDL
jgi:hypothetical protein